MDDWNARADLLDDEYIEASNKVHERYKDYYHFDTDTRTGPDVHTEGPTSDYSVLEWVADIIFWLLS